MHFLSTLQRSLVLLGNAAHLFSHEAKMYANKFLTFNLLEITQYTTLGKLIGLFCIYIQISWLSVCWSCSPKPSTSPNSTCLDLLWGITYVYLCMSYMLTTACQSLSCSKSLSLNCSNMHGSSNSPRSNKFIKML